MAKRIKFSDLLPIYRAMNKVGGSIYHLVVANDILKASLALAVDESNIDESGITVREGDYNDIKIGDAFVIVVEQPRIGLGILADSFADYLNATGSRVKERNNFYIINDDYSSGDERSPVVFNRYRQVLRLVSLIDLSANYLDTAKEELVFHSEGRFVVPVVYDEAVLVVLDIPLFEKFERFVLDPYHKEQKIKMLSDSIIEMLSLVPVKNRFSYLVENLGDLYNRLQVCYGVFTSDYTYQKSVSEIHSFKVDVITRIHKAITDIQVQILGLPVATFVAISQIKKTVALDSQFSSNTVILFGVTIFCFLLLAFLINQKATLDTIGSEVSRQKDVFGKRFLSDPKIYSGEFEAVSTRLIWQYSVLCGVLLLDLLMFMSSIVYYVVHTRPVYDVFF